MIVLINEDELWEKRSKNPTAKGVPEYYCMSKNDGVQFFPSLDPTKCCLMCKEGVV